MATMLTNEAKYKVLKGDIKYHTDAFKIILMGTTYSFDPVAHTKYADVSAKQLATGNGYTTGGLALTGVSVVKDDVANRGSVTWNTAVWNASGGDIGPAVGALIYDDTDTNKMLIGYLDFGANKTVIDGGVFSISNIKLSNA